MSQCLEKDRLYLSLHRKEYWERWGPYLSERQWGTVREDYSRNGESWQYFTHDDARSRAYRWGEDGLLGISDKKCRLCFALACWNGRDNILKERLFGVTGPQGNHGEDVKEAYYYLDALPSHAYLKGLYKYPSQAFPYERLVRENQQRSKLQEEFELADTGLFEASEYFDIVVEYAKATPNDIAIRMTVVNRGPSEESLWLLPTLWFRNTWSWGRTGEGFDPKPSIVCKSDDLMLSQHKTLGTFSFKALQQADEVLFTENETNFRKLFGGNNASPYVKDAFHRFLIQGEKGSVNPERVGTKACFAYDLKLQPQQKQVLEFRLFDDTPSSFDNAAVFESRQAELESFYLSKGEAALPAPEQPIWRQALSGLVWNKQFYYYSVKQWLEGDPSQPTPDPGRRNLRNTNWEHLYNRDIISMPDKWEYPWYAAWDLAFHMVPYARIDPSFAKQQLLLLMREWYMHPNGQMPAYEWSFSDVNPPVHAWACWKVYKMSVEDGRRDRNFLVRAFHKLLLNFTWWVNRKDIHGKNLFGGGFLGLDNIGVFDRSRPLCGHLEQADATAWMAFYCGIMLEISVELAKDDVSYEDVASKFFEHFVGITDAMNSLGGTGLWDEDESFYYDKLHLDDAMVPLRIRSLVGIIPLMAVITMQDRDIEHLPGFKKRMQWFLENRKDLAKHVTYVERSGPVHVGQSLLAVPSQKRLKRMLSYILDEKEFFSDFGIRSLSRYHAQTPFELDLDGKHYSIQYEPGESRTYLFGGNSNWRGPIWFPLNYLLIEALEEYDSFYGESFKVECPTGSGNYLRLRDVAKEICQRLVRLFEKDSSGQRPYWNETQQELHSFNDEELILFYEHFHGDNGRGLGANHQTGWTALIALCIEKLHLDR